MIKLSVIIPARTEGSNLVHTCYSIWHALEAEGFDLKETEIIVVDNCSEDNDESERRATKGTSSYLFPRGAFNNRMLRIIYYPIAGNHTARNKGAEAARGKYLYFSDAHISIRPGYFTKMIAAIDKFGGEVHGGLQFHGAYPPVEASTGFGYTWKLGDEMKMTWNNYKLADTPWYIAGSGAWGVMCTREHFFKIRGWQHYHKTYGGEFYFELKNWMLGHSVMVVPDAIGYHLAQPRGYVYSHHSYEENVLNLLYALGADEWRERAYLNYLRKVDKETLDAIMRRGEDIFAADRKWIAKHRKYSFNELLTVRPWDVMNQELHGKSNGHQLIFHWSWLEIIKDVPHVKEAYLNSKYQQQLGEFIETELKDYIYRHDEFEKKYGMEALTRLRKECSL